MYFFGGMCNEDRCDCDKLTLLNDECKSDKGVANANKFIHEQKVHLIIGSTCSSVSLPIVDVTAKAEVPQIIPHSTNEDHPEGQRVGVSGTGVGPLLRRRER